MKEGKTGHFKVKGLFERTLKWTYVQYLMAKKSLNILWKVRTEYIERKIYHTHISIYAEKWLARGRMTRYDSQQKWGYFFLITSKLILGSHVMYTNTYFDCHVYYKVVFLLYTHCTLTKGQIQSWQLLTSVYFGISSVDEISCAAFWQHFKYCWLWINTSHIKHIGWTS